MRPFNRLSILFAAALLATVVGCAASAKHGGSGDSLDNAALSTKVMDAVSNEATLKSSEIHVASFRGVVQLSGSVSSQADIDKAVQIASTVKGVKSVKNDMHIKAQH